jgi:hypothetical protein
MVELYLHDMVLNYLSIDKNLKLYLFIFSSTVQQATQHNSMQCSTSTIDDIVFQHCVPLMYHSLILLCL